MTDTRVVGQDETPAPQAPEIASASNEGERAMAGFKVPDGLKGSLFAAEPLLANPVAIFVDDMGRLYVCETFRQSKGVEDNRGHGAWLNDDLAAQTVEDRLAYIKKHLGEGAQAYTVHDDRIRLLTDSDGDGVADQATVFSDRYNEILAGTGAGVLAYRGDVFYTCIPDLWLLRDEDGDGKADVRRSLHRGYGVRFAFRGHDLHGLIIGPDGRLYFSIGDRGYHVITDDGEAIDPTSGAVFRCELDGSQLEVVATGLRNPQELAFDDYGNLFTGDNNSDSGDRARLVYVVRGGDSGWRMYYQYLNDRGPFNRESIWHPYHEGQPAYIVPPIENFSDGPSGLVHYPGTGLNDSFANQFLLCDFRGQASNSGIRSFKLEPQGAFWSLGESDQPFWNMLPTDLAFGPDGSLYISDWVHGWDGLGKGRIYRFETTDPEQLRIGAEVAGLLGGGIDQAAGDALVVLLGHPDRRVRQESQFELVRREAIDLLTETAKTSPEQMARIHAIWGLGQLTRSGKEVDWVGQLASVLADHSDDETRAQFCRVVGDARVAGMEERLTRLLQDAAPRVRYFAADAFGQLEVSDAFEPLVKLAESAGADDPIERHGAIMGLVGCATDQQLAGLSGHPSRHVRLAAVVAMRKRNQSGISVFLSDPDESVVVEAARAIHDEYVWDEYPALASLIDQIGMPDALARRVANANFRLGSLENAESLLQFICNEQYDANLRSQVLSLVSTWREPKPTDWVLGDWQPIGSRPDDAVVRAMRESIGGLLAADEAIANEAARVAADFGITETMTYLVDLAEDADRPAEARADAMRALEAMDAPEQLARAQQLVDDPQPVVRAAALDSLTRRDPSAAVSILRKVVDAGERLERQSAIGLLRDTDHPDLIAVLRELGKRLNDGELPADCHLDVLEAMATCSDELVSAQLSAYEASRSEDDPLAGYLESLEGGDALNGQKIFLERRDLSCYRCHSLSGEADRVGPDLSQIDAKKDRRYLLESIVAPNETIAEGFETQLIVTIDGLVVSGIIKSEGDEELLLMTADGETVAVPVDDIEDQIRGDSSMPTDLIDQISKRELRDLVEFLTLVKDGQWKVETAEGHD